MAGRVIYFEVKTGGESSRSCKESNMEGNTFQT
jgi:hypothetical protein